ncbi:hypothetical protein OR1_04147 [Geobacter sp. OR-1]|uniref:ribbon-helix-helix domain-containing protein n=1 Tax=Geobacter sp. OR-1 TaxID=1266765 RepID=UPI000541DCDC|nr:hypothetical protein [Geobacter sp. OR-1]GAM11829.1 hypothetical protein OR1_04147 [Geobacter sp. OR-1]
MGFNKETHTNVSVVMTKEIYEKLKQLADRERRSVSKQVLFWIEERLEAKDNS